MNKQVLTTLLAATLVLTACANQPDKVVATYVSPTTYSSFNCRQIISERNRIVQKVNELSGVQKKKADNDAAAMGIGMILFWPALFALGGGSDVEPQLASMKGNYDALTAVGTQKNCF
ncbi:MAG: hypothetical protein Q7J44_08640 [Pseudotabrizicola sp.]|uniref:hypothetical protein n=1 Tax=Pseudotabrizicola sp. TaxID=2939647 RepID=UPI00271D9600|nr:hypothetical protein [Pseudotabrizicola sp.]MDO9638596.1 hypothetical protein [Pseudotabrizicola sp.]